MKLKAVFKTLRRKWNDLLGQTIGAGRQGWRNAGKVAGRWSGLASEAFVHDLERVSWTGIPQVHLNHNYLLTGSRETHWGGGDDRRQPGLPIPRQGEGASQA